MGVQCKMAAPGIDASRVPYPEPWYDHLVRTRLAAWQGKITDPPEPSQARAMLGMAAAIAKPADCDVATLPPWAECFVFCLNCA